MTDHRRHFANDRHALYAGWLIGTAMREGVVIHPIVNQDGNYTDRIWVASLNAELVVPEPPDDWDFDGRYPQVGADE